MTHLISAKDLEHEVEDVVVIDVRWTRTADGTSPGRDEYAAGHVPGAFFVDLDAELAGPPGSGGRHPLPDPAVIESALRRCGISEHTRVVVYDGRESYAAARAWWVLRWVGVAGARVLDGGYAAWLRAGLPVSTEIPEPRHGAFVAQPGRLPTLDAAGAADLARTGLLLDAREPERFRGEAEPIDPVAGHILGAVSSPASDWLAPDGTFRTDLREHWAQIVGRRDRDPGDLGDLGDLGDPGDLDGRVGAYCGSGVTAAHEILALAEIGVDGLLYPGSWSEWITDPTRPVATGP